MLCNGKSFGIIATYWKIESIPWARRFPGSMLPEVTGRPQQSEAKAYKGHTGRNSEGSPCSVDVWETAHVDGGRLVSGHETEHRPELPTPSAGAFVMFSTFIWRRLSFKRLLCLLVGVTKAEPPKTVYSYPIFTFFPVLPGTQQTLLE